MSSITSTLFVKNTFITDVDWITSYRGLALYLPYIVNVHSVDTVGLKMYMDKVDGVTALQVLDFYDNFQIDKLVIFLINVIFDLEETVLTGNLYGKNLDLALDNIMISEDNFVIIDPDSFNFKYHIDYVNYTTMLEHLDQVLIENNNLKKKQLMKIYNQSMDTMSNGKNGSVIANKKIEFYNLKKKYGRMES